MHRSIVFVSAVALPLVASLTACANLNTGMKSVWEPDQACATNLGDDPPLTPFEAVVFVTRNPAHCGSGTFAMTVHSTGHVGSVLYLNSNPDPNDPDNLAVAVLPRAREQFAAQFGVPAENHLLGQTILVTGTVRLAPLPYTWTVTTGGTAQGWGVPRSKFHGSGSYYASHVLVTSADNVALVASGRDTPVSNAR